MKNKELIKILCDYPDDMTVCVNGYEGGYDDIQKIKTVKAAMNVLKSGNYNGQHLPPDDMYVKKRCKVKEILILSRRK